jgi:1-acyl-sn-glycerol-3-phosphate acyltransferase
MSRDLEHNRLYALVKIILMPLLKTVLGLQVRNAERLPAAGAVIVAANHVSNFDPLVVAAASPRQLCFLAKVELFRVPVLSFLLRRVKAIPLRRHAADRGALVAALSALQAGRALLLFPEGTRSKTGEIQEGKRGVAMLAVKNRANVIPVHVSGTFRLWPFLWRRRAVVEFGKPVEIGPFLKLRLSSKHLYARIGAEIMNRIKELRDAHHDRIEG